MKLLGRTLLNIALLAAIQFLAPYFAWPVTDHDPAWVYIAKVIGILLAFDVFCYLKNKLT